MTAKGGRILFSPAAKEAKEAEGKTILEAAREAGVYVDAPCGGKGLCGKCAVHVVEGEAESPSEHETALLKAADREADCRLACMARVKGDMSVVVPQDSLVSHVGDKLFAGRSTAIDPVVKGYPIDLTEGAPDAARIERVTGLMTQRHEFDGLATDPAILPDLGRTGTDLEAKITVFVWQGKEIVGVSPGWAARRLGLALDVGTTTVAAYVADLDDGRLIATGSVTNPQVLFGTDVMSRIAYSSRSREGVKEMQATLIASVNALVSHMAKERDFDVHEIVDATAVGNTVMHHILLAIPPDRLGVWPFTPTVRRSVDVKARDLGLDIGRASYVHVLPVEASFVGADNVAVLLSEAPHTRDEISLVIDLGTNGEIVLGNRQRLLSCSCATGPALEGAHISSGMRAIEGAIDTVRINPDTLDVAYTVIGKEGVTAAKGKTPAPAGLCGSAVIDAVAQLYGAGLIKRDGAFSRIRETERLRKGATGLMEFVVAWKAETKTGRDIVLTQKDIREVQLAKGALYGGWRVLMGRLNVSRADRIAIAGAFGMHLNKESALTLGLFPGDDPDHLVMVGNAAGHGAYLALMDAAKRKEADRLAAWVEHIELAREETFHKEFVNGLSLP